MRIDIMTLFPDSLRGILDESIIGRAAKRGYITIECHQIRDYTTNKQNQVDDYPYGGGRGCVMQAQPLYDCWRHICEDAGYRVHTIYMSPCGKVFKQADAKRLKNYDRLIIVCGHYEGVDERFIEECVDEEISVGDFVVTGGEIPALAITDAICRLVPGVLADEECYTDESHWSGTLEYPQYTR
ncbi:MAG: tRNA (guanosine(37)-N1)-methyltransferase TrmD, partial [Oscillospiraceae bacterium]|nr:tRNA (guanosine(37)-N1)-methyltransferase TrmD [Oscillospiraceae bacterium]